MKKKIISMCLCLLLVLVFLTGCGEVFLQDNPNKDIASSGNGGLCVQKGDYLYFSNGYFPVANFNESTFLDGDDYLGAIYRVQLVNGELSYTDGVLNNVELVCNKIVGNEVTKLYIFEDKIYFSSPNTLKDSTDKIRTDLPVFYTVNINGSGLKKLYSPNAYSKGQYEFYGLDNNVYLSFFDGSSLRILAFNQNNKCILNKVVAENVTSVAMPKVNAFNPLNKTLVDGNDAIYYTRGFNEEESELVNGNVMAKALLKDAQEIVLKSDNENSYTIKDFKNGNVYFTKADYQSIFNSNIYYYINYDASDFATNSGVQITSTKYTTVLIAEKENNNLHRGVIVYNDSALYYISNINSSPVQLYSGEIKVLTTKGSEVYFIVSNKLKKVDFITTVVTDLSPEETTIDTAATTYYSLDSNSNYLYYFVSYTGESLSGLYLCRTSVSAMSPSSEFVGHLLDRHIKPVEED